MSRRVLVSKNLPPLRSGNPEIDNWVQRHLQPFVSQVHEQLSFLTPEYGSFTPSIRGSGTAGTYELAQAYGHYYKIGDLVVASLAIQFAAALTAGGTGDVQILGLPFEKSQPVTNYYPTGSVILGGIDTTAAAVSVALGFSSSTAETSTLVLQQTIDNATNVLVPIASVAVNDTITGTIIFTAGDRAA